jgi:hypothetical protein
LKINSACFQNLTFFVIFWKIVSFPIFILYKIVYKNFIEQVVIKNVLTFFLDEMKVAGFSQKWIKWFLLATLVPPGDPLSRSSGWSCLRPRPRAW